MHSEKVNIEMPAFAFPLRAIKKGNDL